MRKIDFFSFSVSDTGDYEKQTWSTPERSRAYYLDVTSRADSQPASYTRLVGRKVIKLGSSEAHWYLD